VKDASLRDASLRRDPQSVALTAGILSFLMAGLGHFLIAQKLRGAIWLGVWLLATTMIAALGETAAVLAVEPPPQDHALERSAYLLLGVAY
jgi:hypothetical protein